MESTARVSCLPTTSLANSSHRTTIFQIESAISSADFNTRRSSKVADTSLLQLRITNYRITNCIFPQKPPTHLQISSMAVSLIPHPPDPHPHSYEQSLY